jgi:hypothetical protein
MGIFVHTKLLHNRNGWMTGTVNKCIKIANHTNHKKISSYSIHMLKKKQVTRKQKSRALNKKKHVTVLWGSEQGLTKTRRTNEPTQRGLSLLPWN